MGRKATTFAMVTAAFLGKLPLGHAGFLSVGAYAGCIFAIHMEELLPMAVRFPLAMLVGGLVAAVFGILIGIPVLRLKGNYLAIVTLAFVVASFFAGEAGVLYGHNYSILTAGTFDYNKSIEILVIVVLGDMGRIRGSVIADIYYQKHCVSSAITVCC